MIVTYCRYCGGQYTTLDANVSDSQAKRNQCLQCGRLLTRNPKSKWSHLFTPRRFNIDSEPLMLMLGQIILPDLKEEVFRRAFRGFSGGAGRESNRPHERTVWGLMPPLIG